MTIRVILAAAAVAALAGCGASVDTTGKLSIGHKTLSVSAVPFTFEYPLAFREATDASVAKANALAVVGPGANSYIAVRRNGPAMSLAALERQARTALGGAIVSSGRERHSGIAMVAVTIRDTGGAALGLRSTIYGFSFARASWLIECHSTAADRQKIAAGCAQALDSIQERTAS